MKKRERETERDRRVKNDKRMSGKKIMRKTRTLIEDQSGRCEENWLGVEMMKGLGMKKERRKAENVKQDERAEDNSDKT